MKRILCVFIAALTCVSLVSCGRHSSADAVRACYGAAKKLMDDGDYDAARKLIDEAVAKYGDGALLDSLIQQMEPTTSLRSEETTSEESTEADVTEPETTITADNYNDFSAIDADLSNINEFLAEIDADLTETDTENYFRIDEIDEAGIWTDEEFTDAQTTKAQKETTTQAAATTTMRSTEKQTVSPAKPQVTALTVPATTRASQTQAVPTTVPVTAEVNTRQQALTFANTYRKQAAVSRSQMIDQMKKNGFSEADAIYAANHSGADWNIQAFKAAKNLAAGNNISREELKNALRSAGFSDSQVSYAVDRVSLPQNAQAEAPAQTQTSADNEYLYTVLKDQLQANGSSVSDAMDALTAM